MTEEKKDTAVTEFLAELERDPKLLKKLKLGRTYEKRLADALADAQMRAYLEDGLNTIAGLNIVLTEIPEGMMPQEAVLLAASAVIKGRLVEKAMWDAKNPGKPFSEYV